MSETIPLIDLSPMNTAEGLRQVAARIGPACREVGFFYVTGHGLENRIADVFAQSAKFFAAGENIKRDVLFSGATGNRGYIPMKGEALDPTRPADLKEAFNIGLELPDDDPELIAGRIFRARNQWPDLDGFRSTMLDYFDSCHRLGIAIHQAFAIDLGLRPDFFSDKLDRPMAVLRLLHYPAKAGSVEPGQMGAGEHTDYGCITLLATDGVGGLEVRRRDGRWISAPHIPGTLVCNIGDCLMRWTNDHYVSTPHRVQSPPDRERYSVAFFLDPNPDAEVACLPGCANADRPARYEPIKGEAFLLSRLNPTYQKSGLAGG